MTTTLVSEKREWRYASLAGALALCLYTATAARTVQGGDSGEFATIAATGGVAHPPGYPLYVLWLRAFVWLPALSPAHRASLATALCGALTVALVFRASRTWGSSLYVSIFVTSVCAFSRLGWQLATVPEVFALNAVLALAIVITAGSDRVSGVRRVALLALYAGLGLSNHHSIVLIAPLGLWGLWRGFSESKRFAIGCLTAASVFLVGLVPYLYLVAAARHLDPNQAWIWGHTNTWRGLSDHFLRREYGTTSLGLVNDSPRIGDQWTAFVSHVVRFSAAVPLAVLVAPFGRAKSNQGRIGWITLVASFVVAGPLFLARFNLSPKDLHADIVERFYWLPMVIGFAGSGPLLDTLSSKLVKLGRARSVAAVSVCSVLFAVSLRAIAERHRPTLENYVQNALATAESNAILVGGGDHRFGAFLYAQRALKLRPDVDFIHPRLLLSTWYPPQVERALGTPLTRAVNHRLDGANLMLELLATKRPIYLTDFVVAQFRTDLPSYPVGPLVRVVRSWESVPRPDPLLELNTNLFSRFTMESSPVHEAWAADVQEAYVRPWLSLARAFDELGRFEQAEACRARADALMPEGHVLTLPDVLPSAAPTTQATPP